MDQLTLVLAILGGIAALLGIPAAIVQVLQYRQDRLGRRQQAEQALSPTPVEKPALVIPNNLPSRGEFIGRQVEKERVKEALASRWPLICIDGIGGIGKTSLALEVVGECLQLSKDDEAPASPLKFDGFIWTSAKDRELTLNDVLDTIARTLDYPGVAQQPLDDKREAVRRLLQAKCYLLVIDNFETITDDAVRDFLLALPEPTKALVTSRTLDLRQAWSVSLKGMDQTEALTLMRNEGLRLGLTSIETAPDQDLLRLYQGTGGAPLAMKWAIGQIKQKGQSLDTVLAYLYEARGDIFENIFARSWDLLGEQARHVLTVMPIFAASVSRDAIEAASDVHHWELDEALGQLVQLWLVEVSEHLDQANRRYNLHPLTRSFARTKLQMIHSLEFDARFRSADYYATQAGQKDGWYRSEEFPWFRLELQNILPILDWAYSVEEYRLALDLTQSLMYFWGASGYWRERIAYGGKAIEAAQLLDNPSLQGWFNLMLAYIFFRQGYLDDAKTCAIASTILMQRPQDDAFISNAFDILSGIARSEGKLDEARELAAQALDTAQETGLVGSIYAAYRAQALIALLEGNYSEAERLFRSALEGFERLGSRERAAGRHIELGLVNLLQGRYNQARSQYEIGLRLGQETGQTDNIADAQYGLARVEEELGDLPAALQTAHSAHEIYTRLAMKQRMDETQKFITELEERMAAHS